jgi:hypothetical protein
LIVVALVLIGFLVLILESAGILPGNPIARYVSAVSLALLVAPLVAVLETIVFLYFALTIPLDNSVNSFVPRSETKVVDAILHLVVFGIALFIIIYGFYLKGSRRWGSPARRRTLPQIRAAGHKYGFSKSNIRESNCFDQ